jgi:hypothetical protein
MSLSLLEALKGDSSIMAAGLRPPRAELGVPVEGVSDEFAAGASPVDVCVRTLRACMEFGARHFYISNLHVGSAFCMLAAIMEQAGVTARPAPQQS